MGTVQTAQLQREETVQLFDTIELRKRIVGDLTFDPVDVPERADLYNMPLSELRRLATNEKAVVTRRSGNYYELLRAFGNSRIRAAIKSLLFSQGGVILSPRRWRKA
jgi:hypothetical protein